MLSGCASYHLAIVARRWCRARSDLSRSRLARRAVLHQAQALLGLAGAGSASSASSGSMTVPLEIAPDLGDVVLICSSR